MSKMPYFFPDKQSPALRKVIEADLKSHWSPNDIALVKFDYASKDLEQLRHIVVPLAYGECTAFHGFGSRISEAETATLKLWLCTHLLDEGRHSVAFSRYLENLYGSHESFEDFPYRNVVRFYGHTAAQKDIDTWLFCTTCAEIFGRFVYKSLADLLPDQSSRDFFSLIVDDEQRHIGFLQAYLTEKSRSGALVLDGKTAADWTRLLAVTRDMFEGRRRGATYESFRHFGIPISEYCDQAEAHLLKLINKVKECA